MVGPVVDVAWLDEHRDQVVLADVRWALGGPPGREAFEAGHVPGAVFVDLDLQLAAPASPAEGRHPLPTPEDFAAAMSSLGIVDGTTVVGYDDSRGSSASRLVWMLRVLGHDAALLDGGLAAWTAAHGPEALRRGVGAASRRPDRPGDALVPGFTPVPWPADRVVDADTVAALASSGVALLDARDHGRFTGDGATPADPRPGHIPGAVSAPWAANLDEHGRLLDAAALRAHYAAVGVDVDDPGPGTEPPVLYCGSGVTASLDLLALEVAGVEGARLYPGSWSQWASDPTRPVATGD